MSLPSIKWCRLFSLLCVAASLFAAAQPPPNVISPGPGVGIVGAAPGTPGSPIVSSPGAVVGPSGPGVQQETWLDKIRDIWKTSADMFESFREGQQKDQGVITSRADDIGRTIVTAPVATATNYATPTQYSNNNVGRAQYDNGQAIPRGNTANDLFKLPRTP
eukprot:gb/GEZN01020073.1/.p1 GENE.gb/GEZN01020073.1/~~gb/GEZN01020073.1/.p1  ORF type:complete len:162 (+),score=16.27 gb/GEZN01020073.1/:29-514(+)